MLRLENVTFDVIDENGKEKRILNNINLEIPEDKFIVITGPNGSGKSTLARILMGIEKPTSGKIYLNDVDVTDKSITERANLGISFALQSPVRFKGIKVHDLINIAAKRDLSTNEACEYLSRVGLCARDYIDREVNSSLSGGELKRIEIATVLARGTKVAIFDEPEAGIDLWSFQSLIKVFEDMRAEVKGSIIIISHQERILNIADEIILLKDGTIAKRGKKQDMIIDVLGATLEGGICGKVMGGNDRC